MRALFTGRDLGTKSLPHSGAAKDCKLEARTLKEISQQVSPEKSHGPLNDEEDEDYGRLQSLRLSWLGGAGAEGAAGGRAEGGAAASATADVPQVDMDGRHGGAAAAAAPLEAEMHAPSTLTAPFGTPPPTTTAARAGHAQGGGDSLAFPKGTLALVPPGKPFALGTAPSLPPPTPGGDESRIGLERQLSGEGGKTVRSPKSRDCRNPAATAAELEEETLGLLQEAARVLQRGLDSGQFQLPESEDRSPKKTLSQRLLPKGAQVDRRNSNASVGFHVGVRALASGRSSATPMSGSWTVQRCLTSVSERASPERPIQRCRTTT